MGVVKPKRFPPHTSQSSLLKASASFDNILSISCVYRLVHLNLKGDECGSTVANSNCAVMLILLKFVWHAGSKEFFPSAEMPLPERYLPSATVRFSKILVDSPSIGILNHPTYSPFNVLEPFAEQRLDRVDLKAKLYGSTDVVAFPSFSFRRSCASLSEAPHLPLMMIRLLVADFVNVPSR